MVCTFVVYVTNLFYLEFNRAYNMVIQYRKNMQLLFSFDCFVFFFRCRTIGFETGAQSGQICTTILMLSFKPEILKSMFAYPVIYILFQIIEGLILVTGRCDYCEMKDVTEVGRLLLTGFKSQAEWEWRRG